MSNQPGQVVQFPRAGAPEAWVDEKTLAQHFATSTRTVRRWRAAGMPSRLLGGSRRYRISEAENWLYPEVSEEARR